MVKCHIFGPFTVFLRLDRHSFIKNVDTIDIFLIQCTDNISNVSEGVYVSSKSTIGGRKSNLSKAGTSECRSFEDELCAAVSDLNISELPFEAFVVDRNDLVRCSNSSGRMVGKVASSSIENAIASNDIGRISFGGVRSFDPVLGPVACVRRTQKTIRNVEIRFECPDHDPIFLNAGFSRTGADGCVLVAYYDVTDIKRIHSELEESRYRYKNLLSNLPVTIIVHRNGKIMYSNDGIKNLLGYRPFEINRCMLSKLFADGWKDVAVRLSSAGKIDSSGEEVELESSNGEKKPVRMRSYEIEFNGEASCMIVVEDISRQKKLEHDITKVKRQLIDKYSYGDIIGKSRQMSDIVKIIPGIASIGCNVLIEGESGSGKSMIARMIHDASGRKKAGFVSVNCGAIPESLFESELFGHTKGAFTDARTEKKGRFAMADGGTIFLDEIGEMPLNLQVKLLKVIEEKRFEPLGSASSVKVDVRVIAATNRDLGALVKSGKFREDLYYRLKVVGLKMPALRDRKDDIELLASHFIDQFNGTYSKRIAGITDELYRFFIRHPFPGNIRELRNMIEHACIFRDDGYIGMKDIPAEYSGCLENRFDDRVHDLTDACEPEIAPEEIAARGRFPILPGYIDTAGAPTKTEELRMTSFEISEMNAIKKALDECGNRRNETMKRLGMSRMTLWRKMKKYGLLNRWKF